MVTLLCSNIKTNKLFASIYFKINHKNVCIQKLATRAISADHLASFIYIKDRIFTKGIYTGSGPRGGGAKDGS